jgi:hypothetical protein
MVIYITKRNCLKKFILFVSLLTTQAWCGELNESGYLRAMYVKDKTDTATALGGSVGIAPSFGNIQTQLAFYTVAPFGVKEDAVSKLFSDKKEGYSTLGVAAIGYKKDALSILIGRQKVITPLVDMDDGRIIPNLFEGASLKYSLDNKTTLEAYYLTRMSGFWSQIYSGEEMSKYISMSKAAGYGDIVPNAALWSVGITHKMDNSQLSGWAYRSPNLIDLLYAEYKLLIPVNADSRVEFSMQGTTQNANGTLQKHLKQIGKTLKQEYLALKIEGIYKNFNIYAAAANISDSKGKLDKNMMNVWAGIPQYTVLNEHVMKSFDTDGAKMYKGCVGYKFTQAIEATASYLYVDALKSKGIANSGVTEFVLSAKKDNFSINGVVLLQNTNNEYKNTILKSTVEYRF